MLRPVRSHKFRLEYIPINFEATTTLTRRHRLQRPALSRRPAGQLDARLEGVPLRLRVRLRHQESRLRRLHPRGEVHRRDGQLDQPDVERVRAARARRFRRSAASAASTSCPNISITGELTGFKLPDSIDSRYDGALRRPRHLRHGELHEQLRREGRLPLARRGLSGEAGHRERSR